MMRSAIVQYVLFRFYPLSIPRHILTAFTHLLFELVQSFQSGPFDTIVGQSSVQFREIRQVVRQFVQKKVIVIGRGNNT
jgi:hypothetical protein